jgi:hypothetical protein
MKKLIFCTVLLTSIAFAPKSFGQWESIRQEGEIGFSAGASHYLVILIPEESSTVRNL